MPVFDLTEIGPQLEEYFAGQPQVLVAYVFGSQTTGKAGPLSDLDVAALLAGEPTPSECFDARLEFIGGLMSLLHTNDVDVLILNDVPLIMRYQVLRTGRVIFCRDRQAMIDFRVRTLNEFFDFKPVLDYHRKVFFERILDGTWLDGYNRYQGTINTNSRLSQIARRNRRTRFRRVQRGSIQVQHG